MTPEQIRNAVLDKLTGHENEIQPEYSAQDDEAILANVDGEKFLLTVVGPI